MLVGAAPSHSSSLHGPLKVQKALIHLCLSPYEDKSKEVLWRGLGLDSASIKSFRCLITVRLMLCLWHSTATLH